MSTVSPEAQGKRTALACNDVGEVDLYALILLYFQDSGFDNFPDEIYSALDYNNLAIKVKEKWHITENGHDTVKSMFAAGSAFQYGFILNNTVNV